jgi:hypothetical protein
MVVLNKKSFKLPRVEKDKFILLLRLGLDYDRAKGTFCVSSYNNIEKLTDTIAEILEVNEVTFAQTCAVCGRDFPCSECKYIDMCATKNLPFQCVCAKCLREAKTFKETT